MIELINEEVNIYTLPAVDRARSAEDAEFTIGDLHGNAMKLIFMLIKHGVASGISSADYMFLVFIYKSAVENITMSQIDRFNTVLNYLIFKKNTTVRLIGDEFADRGSNDYFTLKVLEKLHENNVRVEITVSNHSIEFIQACLRKEVNFDPNMMQGGRVQSLLNLQKIVNKGYVKAQSIVDIAKAAYLPKLKAIAYSLNTYTNEITIYSHAPVGLNNIQNLAALLKVEYRDTSIEDLRITIDSINSEFQKHIANNAIDNLFPDGKVCNPYTKKNLDKLPEAPFLFVMWNRNYDHIERPKTKHDYKLNFVHGHDYDGETKDHIYNLDNILGKAHNANLGSYTALYCHLNLEIELHKLQTSFFAKLELINIKAVEFEKNQHLDAAVAAKRLYESVKESAHVLFENKVQYTEADLEKFKMSCFAAIDAASVELNTQRGWKQIVGNLTLAVVGFGVLFAAAVVINKAVTGNFLFFKTDFAEKVSILEEEIRSIPVPKPSLR